MDASWQRHQKPSAGEVIDVLAGHFLRSRQCSSQLEAILLSSRSGEDEPQQQQQDRAPAMEVCLVELAHAQPLLVEQFVRDPMLLLKHFQRACLVAQHYMISKHAQRESMAVKQDVKVRPFGLPGKKTPLPAPIHTHGSSHATVKHRPPPVLTSLIPKRLLLPLFFFALSLPLAGMPPLLSVLKNETLYFREKGAHSEFGSAAVAGMSLRSRVSREHARVLVNPAVGEVRACMANRLICVRGTVTKMGSPHLVEYKQEFECSR